METTSPFCFLTSTAVKMGIVELEVPSSQLAYSDPVKAFKARDTHR